MLASSRAHLPSWLVVVMILIFLHVVSSFAEDPTEYKPTEPQPTEYHTEPLPEEVSSVEDKVIPSIITLEPSSASIVDTSLTFASRPSVNRLTSDAIGNSNSYSSLTARKSAFKSPWTERTSEIVVSSIYSTFVDSSRHPSTTQMTSTLAGSIQMQLSSFVNEVPFGSVTYVNLQSSTAGIAPSPSHPLHSETVAEEMTSFKSSLSSGIHIQSSGDGLAPATKIQDSISVSTEEVQTHRTNQQTSTSSSSKIISTIRVIDVSPTTSTNQQTSTSSSSKIISTIPVIDVSPTTSTNQQTSTSSSSKIISTIPVINVSPTTSTNQQISTSSSSKIISTIPVIDVSPTTSIHLTTHFNTDYRHSTAKIFSSSLPLSHAFPTPPLSTIAIGTRYNGNVTSASKSHVLSTYSGPDSVSGIIRRTASSQDFSGKAYSTVPVQSTTLALTSHTNGGLLLSSSNLNGVLLLPTSASFILQSSVIYKDSVALLAPSMRSNCKRVSSTTSGSFMVLASRTSTNGTKSFFPTPSMVHPTSSYVNNSITYLAASSVCSNCSNFTSLMPSTWNNSMQTISVHLPITSTTSLHPVTSLASTWMYSMSAEIRKSVTSTIVVLPTTTAAIEKAPTAPPQNVTAMALSSTSIYVTWQPPPPGTLQGFLHHYEVFVTKLSGPPYKSTHIASVVITTRVTEGIRPSSGLKTSMMTSYDIPVSSVILKPTEPAPTHEPGLPPVNLVWSESSYDAGLNLNLTVSNLEIWTWYEVTVQVVTSRPGPRSPSVFVRTDEDVPSAPQNLSSHSLDVSTVALQWNPPLMPNGVLLRYTVSYSVQGSSNVMNVSIGLDTHYILRDLAPYTVYTIRVAGVTSKGRGHEASLDYLTPEAQPSSPRNFTALAINSSTIRLTWSAPEYPNGRIKYLLYARKYISEPLDERFVYEGVEMEYDVSGLQAYARYLFRVLSCNVKDKSLLSEPANATGTTLATVPSGPPRYLRVIAKSSITMLVTWLPPEEKDWNGPIVHYQLEYHADNGPTMTLYTPDGNTSLLVSSLSPHTVYYFTVQMVNIKGLGPPSEAVYNRTLEDAPSLPTKVQAVTIGPTSVRVTWSKPLHPNGALVKYKVYVRPARGNSSDALVYNGEDTSFLVGELKQNSEYWFTVVAYNGKLMLESGPVIVKQSTHPAAPSGIPRNFTAISLSPTSIQLIWLPPLDGELTGYKVTYSTPGGEKKMLNLAVDIVQLLISELEPYTGYNITLRAVNKVGIGPAAIIFCKTLEDVPGPAIIEQVRNISSTILEVRWQHPKKTNGILKSFKVCWSLEGGATSPCRDTGGVSHALNISHLVPYSEYNISLSASTTVGYGPAVSGVYRTDQGAPSAPLSVKAWNTSSTSIMVRWSSPNLLNGWLTGYRVFYSINVSSSSSMLDAGLSTDATLQGLFPFTVYAVCIRACTRKGCGQCGNATVSTAEGVPGQVSSLIVGSVEKTSVHLQWKPPFKPNGVIGYHVDVWPTVNGHAQQLRLSVPHGSLMLKVSSLNPYVNYTFSVVPFNLASKLEGVGRLVTARTLAAAPSGPPTNIKLLSATPSTLTIQWIPPDMPNGPILRYHVTFYDVQTPVQGGTYLAPGTLYTLTGLGPWNEYAIQIACESAGGLGPTSAAVKFRTQPSAPPTIGTMKPPTDDDVSAHEIVLELVRASDASGRISYYQVIVLELLTDQNGQAIRPPLPPDHYKPSDLVDYNQARQERPKCVPYVTAEFKAEEFDLHRKFTVGQENSTSARIRRANGGKNYYNGPLEPETFYSVFQRAYVKQDLYTSGAWIEPVSTSAARLSEEKRLKSNSNPGLVAGLSVSFALLIVILIVVILFVWKKRRFEFGVIVDDSGDYTGRSLKLKKLRKRRTSSKGLMGSTDSLDAIEDLARTRRNRLQPIPVEAFAMHVRRMHMDGDIGFSEEYEMVQPNDETFTWHHSLHPANKYKNRYANIVAYDHSRVLLTPLEGVLESDYINANYIDGYNRSGAFIASQGPLPETFDDFWRMVWEQGSAIIVMLTQLEERGRRKCDQYWPDRGTRNYGALRVTANETFHMSYYVLRTFLVSHMQEEEEPRQVRQYHYTSWPDHGVPAHPAPLLSMVRTVSSANPPTAGPMIVHCSAGVGRTGTFITLDSMLQRAAQEGTIDVFGFVRQMRNKRNLMVQTESQYVFIHDALVEAVICGVTEVDANKLASRIRELREVDPNIGTTYMDLEFERLTRDERHPTQFKSAMLSCNAAKNRYANILPYERTRVALHMRPGEVGSDYINASFIDGNHRLKAYIATQAPVPGTFEDFWRMLWEQESAVIVMLTREEEAGKLKCHRYWPSDGSRLYDKILVELTEELTYSDYVLRQFSLTHTEEKSSRIVRQFQCTDWPDSGLPESGVGLIDLIGQVEKWQQQSGNTCITVHCSGGVGRTGVFCAVSILIERVKAEGLIDVFQTVQHLRLQRPAMVQTKDQYEFCYTTMQEYLESFDLYANFH